MAKKHTEEVGKYSVGDKVKVKYPVEGKYKRDSTSLSFHHIDETWENTWEYEMDDVIGKKFTIIDIDSTSGVILKGFINYRFPASCLKKVKPEIKVGDRVEIIGNSTSAPEGCIGMFGEVINLSNLPRKPTCYLLRYDKDLPPYSCQVWCHIRKDLRLVEK